VVVDEVGVLEDIVANKMAEVGSICEDDFPRIRFDRASFGNALGGDGLSLVCEIKGKSPSGGVLSNASPVDVGGMYERAGAAAISVLTDFDFFGGSLNDMLRVKQNVGVPVLRKDFIIEKVQLRQARAYGADAVLLIVSVLGERLGEFLSYAGQIGMDALVESRNEFEIGLAVDSGAKIIGINNRDLSTLKVDLGVFERLSDFVPEDVLLVAESGIMSGADARRMRDAGADAILVGSSLMKAGDIMSKVGELRV
jgi:indole-3-glycerol phosphate synthase